ncbi:MAG: outer membrane protein assembly factor BamB [Gammaproteobacteria bacterium]|jgi:outer membrane protein assembly factor BamB|nr:outer membrane protein assembly factor BamB [Gammaproteobacteria bacterium]HJP34431.1 outer membrane protein assembly factor BamB [Gammaproteobacteria bacterium]
MKSLRVTLALAALGLGACTAVTSVTDSVSDLVAGEQDNSIPPTELIKFEPTIDVQKIWSGRFGKGVDNLFIQLIPAPYKEAIYTADRDGRMIALSAATGEELWTERGKKLRISGGPGAGDGLVFAGTSDAEVVARDAESGEEKWIVQVSSEVLAPPRAAGGTVVVRTGDGKLFGLDSETGKRKWVYDRTIPVLTLRGTSAPVIYGGIVIAGFDNGRLVALDLATGKQEWETRLAVPTGRSDLERMVDVDAEPTIADDTAYVASFQANVAAVSIVNGQLEWTRKISSYSNLAVDESRVYVTDELGNVWALDRDTGTSIWKQEGLKARRVTGPAVVGDYVVVGDFEGYLHWIDRETGDFVHRLRLDDERILVPCRRIDDILLAFSSSGVLAAFRPE